MIAVPDPHGISVLKSEYQKTSISQTLNDSKAAFRKKLLQYAERIKLLGPNTSASPGFSSRVGASDPT